jgi:hypothetical protein
MNINILNKIKSENCKNDKKTKMTRKLTMKKNKKMISFQNDDFETIKKKKNTFLKM